MLSRIRATNPRYWRCRQVFTGIIQRVGQVTRADRSAGAMCLSVALGDLAAEVAVGHSVAIDGACLTATTVSGGEVTFDVGAESLRLTTLGKFRPGRRVNIELAVRAGQPLGGHLVLGHVDGVGDVSRIALGSGGTTMEFAVAAELGAQMVLKGSVAVDGVSLTVSALRGSAFEVCLIPHTLDETTLGERKVGDRVNVETDVIGKYVARFLRGRGGAAGVTDRMLEEHGFK